MSWLMRSGCNCTFQPEIWYLRQGVSREKVESRKKKQNFNHLNINMCTVYKCNLSFTYHDHSIEYKLFRYKIPLKIFLRYRSICYTPPLYRTHCYKNDISNFIKRGNIIFKFTYVSREQGWASVLFKRTFRSLRSFAFFIKECSVLSVLFRSL